MVSLSCHPPSSLGHTAVFPSGSCRTPPDLSSGSRGGVLPPFGGGGALRPETRNASRQVWRGPTPTAGHCLATRSPTRPSLDQYSLGVHAQPDKVEHEPDVRYDGEHLWESNNSQQVGTLSCRSTPDKTTGEVGTVGRLHGAARHPQQNQKKEHN